VTDQHPFEQRQSLQEYFRTIMHTVVGQAFGAAGYDLMQEPMQWIGGRFRYAKPLADDLTCYIEFQVLVYNDNDWTRGQPSRFTVNLYRSDKVGGKPSTHAQYVRRSLPQLVVADFGVDILPSASHWWQFDDTDSLGKALAEAGHLIIGYGIPWLAGDLSPDDNA
jgi:hypothetical protein